jgi:hypothetical protein
MKAFDGTKIGRYKDLVGRRTGTKIYVHRFYSDYVVDIDYYKYLDLLGKMFPEMERKFNCLSWNKLTKEIKFFYSPDFDTAREPHIGEWVSISNDKTIRKGKSDLIWHHKWLWVRNNYTKFDAYESINWSELWLSKLKEPAKKTDKDWKKQLKKYKLE